MIDLSTTIANIHFNSPIWNASGPLSTSTNQLQILQNAKTSAIVSKTCTSNKRQGTSQIELLEETSINCEGLTNPGFLYYLSQQFTKPYIISLQPSIIDIDDQLKKIESVPNITMIELNLACPNLERPLCYDLNQLKTILEMVFQIPKTKAIGIKLAPFLDSHQLKEVIQLVSSYSISFITSCNTIPNCFDGKQIFGGLGGKAIKYIALGQVAQIVNHLKQLGKHSIDVIGVGGIFTGKDIFDMLSCGAKAVQIGTCFLIEGPNCFERLENELKLVMQNYGIDTLKNIPIIHLQLFLNKTFGKL